MVLTGKDRCCVMKVKLKVTLLCPRLQVASMVVNCPFSRRLWTLSVRVMTMEEAIM
jgi:hypothetical protein